MSTSSGMTKQRLVAELHDRESRHAYVSEHISSGIPFQIHALREARGWSQKELAQRAGMAQERISVLENPDYAYIPKVTTLLKLAEVFDVPLFYRFGSWEELVDWNQGLSPDRLAPRSFDDAVRDLMRSQESAPAKRPRPEQRDAGYITPQRGLFDTGPLPDNTVVIPHALNQALAPSDSAPRAERSSPRQDAMNNTGAAYAALRLTA
jgi:transcriptional regulator with XRE-family HTH domain